MPVYDVLGVPMTRQQVVALLSQMMSDASERCWYAGWMVGTEEELPAACREHRVGFISARHGMWDLVPDAEAKAMCLLADALGHWISFEGNPYIPVCDGGDGYGQRRAE